MKNTIKLLLVVLLSLGSLQAQPVCSQKIVNELTDGAVSANGSRYFDDYVIKIQSIDGNIVNVWFARIYNPKGREIHIKKLGNKYKYFGYDKSLLSFDLTHEKKAHLSSIYYNCNGDVIDSTTTPSVQYDYILPGSVGEAMFETVKKLVEQE